MWEQNVLGLLNESLEVLRERESEVEGMKDAMETIELETEYDMTVETRKAMASTCEMVIRTLTTAIDRAA